MGCGSRKKCGCNSNQSSLDVWELSTLKGYTELSRDEWIERLNDFINNGVVDMPTDDPTSSLIGTGVIGQMIIG